MHGRAIAPEIGLYEAFAGDLVADGTPNVDYGENVIGFAVSKQVVYHGLCS